MLSFSLQAPYSRHETGLRRYEKYRKRIYYIPGILQKSEIFSAELMDLWMNFLIQFECAWEDLVLECQMRGKAVENIPFTLPSLDCKDATLKTLRNVKQQEMTH